MAQLLVRNVDEDLKRRLKRRAEQHGWSMEEEVRTILRSAVQREEAASVGLGTELAQLFSQLDFDPEIKEMRGHPVEPAKFEP